jgi:anti-anti-sigma regulatory factor
MHTPSVEITNGTAHIHLSGPVVIDVAAMVHQTFLEALDTQLAIQLDLSNVSECDASFVQLLISLCQTLNRGGRTLSLSPNTIPPILRTTLQTLGLSCRNHCVSATTPCLLTLISQESTPQEATTA